MPQPKTLAEWATYIASLKGEVLWSKAIAANSIGFVDQLLAEGYSADEIESILILLGRQFQSLGQTPPGRALYDLEELATRPLPVEVPLPAPWDDANPELDELDDFLAEDH